jgi:hypothetical protein
MTHPNTEQTKRPRERWNRCDSCGRFIPFKDFMSGEASSQIVTPDSLATEEEFETLCANHAIPQHIRRGGK